jgi:hypothetical protein
MGVITSIFYAVGNLGRALGRVRPVSVLGRLRRGCAALLSCQMAFCLVIFALDF